MTTSLTIDTYNFGTAVDLSDKDLRHLIRRFRQTPGAVYGALDGRSAITLDYLDDIGQVAIKHYRRGGLASHLIEQKYVNLGKPRSQREYNFLKHVRKIGINAPEPIAYAYRGRLFYSGWLITRHITPSIALSRLGHTDPQRAQQALESVVQQVKRLIQHKILHVDLHPGNIIVDDKDRAYLVDFDKASIFSGSQDRLRKRYLKRWDRAIRKHHLAVALSHKIHRGLNP